jgi:hypothetical protein
MPHPPDQFRPVHVISEDIEHEENALTRYRGLSGKNIMPQMSIRHGRHWNARGKRQENGLVSGTLDDPKPTHVDTIKPTPIIC